MKRVSFGLCNVTATNLYVEGDLSSLGCLIYNCSRVPLIRLSELLELCSAHERAAEGVVKMEEDGVEAPKPVSVGKPRWICNNI